MRKFSPRLILEDDSIVLLARTRPAYFNSPADITVFLKETQEWEADRALDVYTIITQYDLETKPQARGRKKVQAQSIDNISEMSDPGAESEEVDPVHQYNGSMAGMDDISIKALIESGHIFRPTTPRSTISSQVSSAAPSPPASPSHPPHHYQPELDPECTPKRRKTNRGVLFDATNFD